MCDRLALYPVLIFKLPTAAVFANMIMLQLRMYASSSQLCYLSPLSQWLQLTQPYDKHCAVMVAAVPRWRKQRQLCMLNRSNNV